MRQRKGSTLVELVLSMTAGSTVMLLAISLVHQTMMVTEKSKHRTDHNRTLDQLAESFRRDVHLAETVFSAIADSADSNTLTMRLTDNSEIAYSVYGSTVERKRKNGPEGNEFERFVLDPSSLARFWVLQTPGRAVLQVLSPTGIGERPTKPELIVETIVGRWKALEEKSAVSP